MQTKEQFIQKVEELAERMKQDAIECAARVANSGAIDFEAYRDDYTLPRLFMSAYGDRVKSSWRNPNETHEQKADRINMGAFL